jgi:prefoldin subunit 5
MFENDVFENWLDKQANEIVVKLGEGQSLSSEEMIILVLKAQANHFAHLDQDLRQEMRHLREDMDKRFEQVREDMDKRFEQVDKRFEQVDKRFEQVDKRFEQVDKRFDVLIARMDRFMIWSLGLTFTSTLFILGVMYKLIG